MLNPMYPRQFFIRLVTPLIWRLSENTKFSALQKFSDTELDSGWQSLYTLSRIEDPRAKAELFEHCLDEFYHSDLFANVLGAYVNRPLVRPMFSRDAILDEKADRDAILDFLVQVYVGESEVNRDFLAYAQSNVDPGIREVFSRIKRDEEGHEEVSWELILRYADNRVWKLRWLLLKKYSKRFYDRYVKASQAVGDFMLSLQLSLVYFVVGLFFFRPLRARFALDRGTQLEILRQQVRDYSKGPRP